MIIIFAGAGASLATHRSYGTTKEFLASLPQPITADPIYRGAMSFLTKPGNKQVDVEMLLAALTSARDAAAEFCRQDRLLGALIRGRIVPAAWNEQANVPDAVAVADELSPLPSKLEELIDRINESVYSTYGRRAAAEELAKTWTPLLNALASHADIEVFTTNYDLVLEDAIIGSEIKVATGRRTDGVCTRLDLSLWGPPTWTRRKFVGRLTKLHGSVDWVESNGEIFAGAPLFQGSHKPRVILYPGFKGIPDREPFVTFHRHLRNCVQDADGVVFIGFAFRDDYINSILAGLRPEARVVIIDPGRPSTPLLGRAHHISQGFSDEVAPLVAEHLAWAEHERQRVAPSS